MRIHLCLGAFHIGACDAWAGVGGEAGAPVTGPAEQSGGEKREEWGRRAWRWLQHHGQVCDSSFGDSLCSRAQRAAPESLQVTVASYIPHLGHLTDPGPSLGHGVSLTWSVGTEHTA